jgi:hypothetical protein
LALAQPLAIRVPASSKKVHQAVTFTLSPSQYHLQIIPNLPVANTNRPYRFFVMVNGTKVSETIKPGGDRDRANPVFEARLERGAVHKIEVEVLAVKAGTGEGKEEVQWEKSTCLVQIPRS